MLNNTLQNKIPKYYFKEPIRIINLGDVHYGNVACKKDFFETVIKFIKTNDDIYWVSTGDMLDVNISKSQFHDPNGLEVNFEFEMIVDLLNPISKKCLGFVGSNHSDRIHKLSGLNFDQVLSKSLDIPYLGGLGLICCNLSNHTPIKQNYYIVMCHGKSNAITLGSKANSMSKLSDMFPTVDLVLEGHTHTYMTSQKEINIIDRHTNKLKPMIVTMCICGHCLEWSKSYAADNKYSPTPLGFPLITLHNNRKKIDVKLISPGDIV